MARTNAFICDRCGKATSKKNWWQVRLKHRSWPGAPWREPVDLCDSCRYEFEHNFLRASAEKRGQEGKVPLPDTTYGGTPIDWRRND